MPVVGFAQGDLGCRHDFVAVVLSGAKSGYYAMISPNTRDIENYADSADFPS